MKALPWFGNAALTRFLPASDIDFSVAWQQLSFITTRTRIFSFAALAFTFLSYGTLFGDERETALFRGYWLFRSLLFWLRHPAWRQLV
jgi:hypothetical protein